MDNLALKSGLVCLLINPWVGAALALIDLALFLYDIFKDNELQNWLQKSRFGEGDDFLSSHFKNAREEADQLTLIFEAKIQKIIDQRIEKELADEEKERKLNHKYIETGASAIHLMPLLIYNTISSLHF